MATLREKRDKDGKLIAYYIRIYRGKDLGGRQLPPAFHTFNVADGWSETTAKKKAMAEASVLEHKYKAGLLSDARQTFKEYSEYVLALKARSGVKPGTIDRYKGLMVRVNEGIGNVKLKDMTTQRLNLFYEELSLDGLNHNNGGKLSNKTIKNYHLFISSVLRQAEKELLIPSNPARNASPPKTMRTDANFFEIEDVHRIMECLETEPIKYRTMVHLLLNTGCRRGELVGLKWEHIDLDKGLLHIRNNLLYSKNHYPTLYDSTPKNGKERAVTIPPEMVALLKQYRAWHSSERLKNGDRWKQSEYVFTGDHGGPMHPNNLNIWLARFGKRRGLPHVNAHAFRHTCASIMISQGVDPVTVSKVLGHSLVSTTLDIYAKMFNKGSETASKAISSVVYDYKKTAPK